MSTQTRHTTHILTGLAACALLFSAAPRASAELVAEYTDLTEAPEIPKGNLLIAATEIRYQLQGGTDDITDEHEHFTASDVGRRSDGAATLTDGQFGVWGMPEATLSSSKPGTYAGIISGLITYTLDLDKSPDGYDISEIGVYTGWNNPARATADVQVRYSTVEAPDRFIHLVPISQDGKSLLHETKETGDADDDGRSPAYMVSGPTASGVKALLRDDAGAAVAEHVAKIQFEWSYQQNGFVGYRELSVIGKPSK